jgi:hypothetical protein
MTIHLTCPCGAEMTIEDGSEDRVEMALAMWFSRHAGHRQYARGGQVAGPSVPYTGSPHG